MKSILKIATLLLAVASAHGEDSSVMWSELPRALNGHQKFDSHIIQNRHLADSVSNEIAGRLDQLGEDEQVVSPSRAIKRYRHSAPEDWIKKIKLEERTKSEDDSSVISCDMAINELFQFACNRKTDCPIESRFAAKCENAKTDSRIRKCLAVESTYRNSCFYGSSCAPGHQEWKTKHHSYGFILSGDKIIGSGVLSKGIPDDETSENDEESHVTNVITASHMDIQSGTFQVASRRIPVKKYAFDAIGNSGNISSRILVGELLLEDESLPHNLIEIDVAKPQLFEPTYFLAFNSISYSRHVMSNRHKYLDAHREHYFLCDSSTLCTVTNHKDFDLEHTCQSTKGGSGGALVQKNSEGEFVLVGVNEGSDAKGKVANNLGNAFFKN